jgi:hypothetical protein
MNDMKNFVYSLMITIAIILIIMYGNIKIATIETKRIIEEIRITRAETESVKACIDSLLERGHFVYWGKESCK